MPHVHAFFMHMYHFLLILIYVGTFLFVPLSLFLFLSVSCSMAPRRKSTPSWNPLHVPRNLLLLPFLILLPLTFGSVMRRPVQTSQRTFHDAIFILNAKSSYQIFSILIFPLSSTVKVGSHFVSSQSLVPP